MPDIEPWIKCDDLILITFYKRRWANKQNLSFRFHNLLKFIHADGSVPVDELYFLEQEIMEYSFAG